MRLAPLALVALASAGLAASCSHDWDSFEGSGGAGASGGATSSGGGGSVGTGGSGGTGGATGICGDGKLDADEECDDGNGDDGDGCTACKVDCNLDAGAFKDDQSHHCYWVLRIHHSWDYARQLCPQTGRGSVAAAALASQEEIDFVRPHLAEPSWLGGSWSGSAWTWENGEVWRYGDDQAGAAAPWIRPENDDHGQLECVSLGTDGKIEARDCQSRLDVVCERSPSIAIK